MSNKGKKEEILKLSIVIINNILINNTDKIICIVFIDNINISLDAKDVT